MALVFADGEDLLAGFWLVLFKDSDELVGETGLIF